MSLHVIKTDLINLASKIFNVNPKDLKTDVDLNGKFDFIDVEIHGATSFSPQQQMELENLNYNRDEQGRDYFSSFLTIAIQAGVYLGFQQKEKEIKELNHKLDFELRMSKLSDNTIIELQKNQMGKGTLEDEILKLRGELDEARKQNDKLNIYKHGFDKTQQALDFRSKNNM